MSKMNEKERVIEEIPSYILTFILTRSSHVTTALEKIVEEEYNIWGTWTETTMGR